MSQGKCATSLADDDDELPRLNIGDFTGLNGDLLASTKDQIRTFSMGDAATEAWLVNYVKTAASTLKGNSENRTD